MAVSMSHLNIAHFDDSDELECSDSASFHQGDRWWAYRTATSTVFFPLIITFLRAFVHASLGLASSSSWRPTSKGGALIANNGIVAGIAEGTVTFMDSAAYF
jgi:hypothetical protein